MIYHIKTKKKELFLLIFLCVLLVLYGIAIILFARNNLMEYCFATGLLVFSLYMFAKSIVFRSDSSLFLATLCFMFFLFGILSNFVSFSLTVWLSIVFFCISICHLNLYIFFDNISNFFTFLFYILLFLPIILYSFYCINLLMMILLLSGDLVIFASLFICGKYE